MILDREQEIEQIRVNEVREKLQTRIAHMSPDVQDLREQVVEIRKDLWDEVTVNMSHTDDVNETMASLKQQSELLSERERSHRHTFLMLQKMNRLLPAPYFARIDFVEAETEEGHTSEQIYIGMSSFIDTDGETFLVYDWRTPIASLYYDYAPGPAAYDTPGGTVTGTMQLKRQFIIREGRIRYLFDTALTIGDEVLQQVLGMGADPQMKSIVATIQKEQNAVIRNDRSRLLIVEGAAGSGKTSAVMQRVAYLLYKHRTTLRADQMVLFSPNPLFNSYVSAVLPELGEENIRQTTFQDYLGSRLEPEFQVEDPYDQMEYELTATHQPGYNARLAGIRFKSSALFLQVLSRYKEHLERTGMRFRALKFRGHAVVSAEEMNAKFYSYPSSVRLANRVELMQEWLMERLAVLADEEVRKDWVQEELNYLDNEKYHKAYMRLRKRKGLGNSDLHEADEEEALLRRMVVDEHYKKLRARVRRQRFVHIPALYRQLFVGGTLLTELNDGELPEQWEEIGQYTLQNMDVSLLSYEDAAPYLYLSELVQGFRMNNTVRHVLIDEAQDYSVFQFEFLKRLFPRARMTAVGDFNQAIFTHEAAFRDEEAVANLYGEADTERLHLTRSYRSTREIVEFTRALVPGGERIEPFNRGGDKPRVTLAAAGADAAAGARHAAARIHALRGEGFASVAVICKTAAESLAAHAAIAQAGATEVALVTKRTQALPPGAVVIPAYLAKGVEFDAVVIYDASPAAYRRESERKLFYTACTRAMHVLELYAPGELSPFVAALDPGLYALNGVQEEQPAGHRVREGE
ncbi:helicase [Paenibacillus swuensis]|uniref:Helicase n=1 Tax=Paenibacillus swuensis TaxID=1178515 RepID=A0A172TLZ0_9BACL|nr:RNA polymerase recycling motor HelD [Paenibacillus swuensis]ANE48048.1 helicase [Paenibacillus swuensis]